MTHEKAKMSIIIIFNSLSLPSQNDNPYVAPKADTRHTYFVFKYIHLFIITGARGNFETDEQHNCFYLKHLIESNSRYVYFSFAVRNSKFAFIFIAEMRSDCLFIFICIFWNNFTFIVCFLLLLLLLFFMAWRRCCCCCYYRCPHGKQ